MDPRSRSDHHRSHQCRHSHNLFLVFLCLVEATFVQLNSADGYSALAESQALQSDEFSESKNQKLDLMNPLSSEQELDDKRSSSFFPLRGKKPSLTSAYNHPITYENDEISLEDKRSHFYPLRGKKVPLELKRASYFMPMRGRKDDEEAWWDDAKRMSSFMPMRGKKRMTDSFQNLGKTGMYNTETQLSPSSDSRSHPLLILPHENTAMEKRETKTAVASKKKRSVGFVAMRGKRSVLEDGSSLRPSEGDNKESFMDMDVQKHTPHQNQDNDNQFLEERDEVQLAEKDRNLSEIRSGKDEGSWKFTPTKVQKNYLYDTQAFADETIQGKRKFSFTPMRGRRSNDYNDWTPVLDLRVRDSYDLPAEEFDYDSSQQRKGVSLLQPFLEGDTQKRLSINDFISDRDLVSLLAFQGTSPKVLKDMKTSMALDSYPSGGRSLVSLPSFQDILSEDLVDKKASKGLDFFPTRGRSIPTSHQEHFYDKRGFMAKRGSRGGEFDSNGSFYRPFPYFVPPGIGSSLMFRQFNRGLHPARTTSSKTRKFDWDSVKRAFHATRGKRYSTDSIEDNLSDSGNQQNLEQDSNKGCRCKRSIRRQVLQNPHKQYIALKRPMSFFATRGKRPDPAVVGRQ